MHKTNQIFHLTRCNTPKCVTSRRGPSTRDCAPTTQLLSKCRSGGELLATLCQIGQAGDLNLRPPAPKTAALLLNHLFFCVITNTARCSTTNEIDHFNEANQRDPDHPDGDIKAS